MTTTYEENKSKYYTRTSETKDGQKLRAKGVFGKSKFSYVKNMPLCFKVSLPPSRNPNNRRNKGEKWSSEERGGGGEVGRVS